MPEENQTSPSLSDQIADRTCRFCNASFTRSKIRENHERKCATQTPEQRAKVAQSRDYHRQHYSKAVTPSERFHGGRRGMRRKKPRQPGLVDTGFRSPLTLGGLDTPVVKDLPGRNLVVHVKVPRGQLAAILNELAPLFNRIELKLETQ